MSKQIEDPEIQFTPEQSKVFIAFVHAYEAANLIDQVLETNKSLVLKYPDGRFTKLGKELGAASARLEDCVRRMFPDNYNQFQGDFLNFLAKHSSVFLVELVNEHILMAAKIENGKNDETKTE